MLTLFNKSRRPLEFVLLHEVWCNARSKAGISPACTCQTMQGLAQVKNDAGQTLAKITQRRVPGSFTVPSNTRVEAADEILLLPDVQKAIAAGDLLTIRTSTKAAG